MSADAYRCARTTRPFQAWPRVGGVHRSLRPEHLVQRRRARLTARNAASARVLADFPLRWPWCCPSAWPRSWPPGARVRLAQSTSSAQRRASWPRRAQAAVRFWERLRHEVARC